MSASPYQHWEWCGSFSVGRLQMFPLLNRAFSPWIIVQTPGLTPPTIRSRNLSPSISHRSTYSQQIPMPVAFCSSYKIFGTHTAETIWCSCSTIPRCSLICRSVTWRSHYTIWSTLQSVSGFTTWHEWPGRARFSVLLLLPLNLLHHSTTAVHCSCRCAQASSEKRRLLVLHLPHKETGWRSTVRTWTNPWLSAVQHAFVQTWHRTACLWCVPIAWVVNNVGLDENNPTIQIVLFIIKPLHNPSLFILLSCSHLSEWYSLFFTSNN